MSWRPCSTRAPVRAGPALPLGRPRPVVRRAPRRAGAGQVAVRGLPDPRRVPGRCGAAGRAVGRLGRRDLRARRRGPAQAAPWPSAQGGPGPGPRLRTEAAVAPGRPNDRARDRFRLTPIRALVTRRHRAARRISEARTERWSYSTKPLSSGSPTASAGSHHPASRLARPTSSAGPVRPCRVGPLSRRLRRPGAFSARSESGPGRTGSGRRPRRRAGRSSPRREAGWPPFQDGP